MTGSGSNPDLPFAGDVLLVDDHARFRKAVAELLGLAPGSYREVGNGLEALAACETDGDSPKSL